MPGRRPRCSTRGPGSARLWILALSRSDLLRLMRCDVDVVGEVGRGFYHLLDGLNPERVVNALEAIVDVVASTWWRRA